MLKVILRVHVIFVKMADSDKVVRYGRMVVEVLKMDNPRGNAGRDR